MGDKFKDAVAAIDRKHARRLGEVAAREGRAASDCHYDESDPLRTEWQAAYAKARAASESQSN